MAFNSSGVSVARLLAVSITISKIPAVPTYKQTTTGYTSTINNRNQRQEPQHRRSEAYNPFEDVDITDDDNDSRFSDDEYDQFF